MSAFGDEAETESEDLEGRLWAARMRRAHGTAFFDLFVIIMIALIVAAAIFMTGHP